jgi:enoyl-CoA hydratase/carnithine racemase
LARTGDHLAITLDRPEKRNAVSASLRDQLLDALAVAGLDPTIGAVTLAGHGPSFCAGGDLNEFGLVPDPAVGHLVRTGHGLPGAALACADRLTALVHGPTVGAGVELAAFAATVVARPGTTFRLPEVAMGLVPGAGGTVSVTRRIGRHRTAAMAIGGRAVPVDVAVRWGLVDRIDAAGSR